MILRYPFALTEDGDFFLETFPDVPETITQGETLEEALHAAKEALESALEFYTDDGRPWPTPSPVKPGGFFVELEGASKSP